MDYCFEGIIDDMERGEVLVTKEKVLEIIRKLRGEDWEDSIEERDWYQRLLQLMRSAKE